MDVFHCTDRHTWGGMVRVAGRDLRVGAEGRVEVMSNTAACTKMHEMPNTFEFKEKAPATDLLDPTRTKTEFRERPKPEPEPEPVPKPEPVVVEAAPPVAPPKPESSPESSSGSASGPVTAPMVASIPDAAPKIVVPAAQPDTVLKPQSRGGRGRRNKDSD